MDEEREKIIEKAFKIRELANRGIDGEKDNAIRMLVTYRETHEITDAEMNLFTPFGNNSWYEQSSPEERSGKFAQWFRKSITVYKDKPIIFYHKSRTVEPFTEFRHDLGRKHYYNQNGYGFAFVHQDESGRIAHIGNDHLGRGCDFHVYLRMINPYYIFNMLNGNSHGQNGEQYRPIQIDKALADSVVEKGFDSIIIQCQSNSNVYIVFNSTQIKSIKNDGEYSSDNDNIYS